MKKLPPIKALPVEIPRPRSRRPWHRKPNLPPVYDADGKVVSFIENAPFLFHVEQLHEPLIVALDVSRASSCSPAGAGAPNVEDITDTLKIVNTVLKRARGKL
jgi:hypothetical protein